MKTLIKPRALKPGDTIASISLSSGSAGLFPKRYEQGVKQIEESFGVKVIPTPHALCTPEEVYEHPEWRLSDFMWAFENPEVKGNVCLAEVRFKKSTLKRFITTLKFLWDFLIQPSII